MGGFDALMDRRIALDQETGESRFGSLLLAGWAFVCGRLCAISLDEEGDTPSPLLSFSNLGTIEVRFQIGADPPHLPLSPGN